MATPTKTKVLDNKTLGIAATGDSTMVPCRGAKLVQFLFISSASEVFAAASAFQVQVRTETNESILTPATPSKHGVSVVNATDLNAAAANAGILVSVVPSNAQIPYLTVREMGCRVTAGGVAMTDVDCYAFVYF